MVSTIEMILIYHKFVESEMDGLSVAYGHAALAAVVELAKEVVQLRQKIKTLESNI
jgi:hypothetical protein